MSKGTVKCMDNNDMNRKDDYTKGSRDRNFSAASKQVTLIPADNLYQLQSFSWGICQDDPLSERSGSLERIIRMSNLP